MITEVTLLDNVNFNPLDEFRCDGSFQFGDRIFGCWYTNGHGNMNLSSAISSSCDIYFYRKERKVYYHQKNKGKKYSQ